MSKAYEDMLQGFKEFAEITNNDKLFDEVTERQNKISRNEDLEETSQIIDDDTSNHGMLGLVNSLIISEYDAIDQYNSAIATAEATGHLDIIPVLEDIIREEQTHVGQLQQSAKLFDDSADSVESGRKEAADQLEQGKDYEDELDTIELSKEEYDEN